MIMKALIDGKNGLRCESVSMYTAVYNILLRSRSPQQESVILYSSCEPESDADSHRTDHGTKGSKVIQLSFQ